MLFLLNKTLKTVAHTIHAHTINTLTHTDPKSSLNTQPQPPTDRRTANWYCFIQRDKPSVTHRQNTDNRRGPQKDANDSFISTFLCRYFFLLLAKMFPTFFSSPFLPLLFFSFLSFSFFVSTAFLRASLELNWSRPGHAVQSAARATSRLATGTARAVKGRNRARESTLLDPYQGVLAEDNRWDTTELQFQPLRADSGLWRVVPEAVEMSDRMCSGLRNADS